MKIMSNSRVLFIGDSITDVQRAQPIGQGLFNPLGQGYPHFINALLTATYPEANIHVINVGVSGNRVRDLAERWERDVMNLNPDYVSICIGINDVWRHFDCPTFPADFQVSLDEYEKTLDELIKKTLPILKNNGLILLTPYFIESNPKDAMRLMMDEFGAKVKQLAKKYDANLIDTQAVFDDLLKTKHSCYYSWDRVHPNAPGHAAIAKAWLKVMEYKF